MTANEEKMTLLLMHPSYEVMRCSSPWVQSGKLLAMSPTSSPSHGPQFVALEMETSEPPKASLSRAMYYVGRSACYVLFVGMGIA